jgi:hypothetical protein
MNKLKGSAFGIVNNNEDLNKLLAPFKEKIARDIKAWFQGDRDFQKQYEKNISEIKLIVS